MHVCFWSPASIPFTNYKAVGFQPQVVGIPELRYVHPPRYIFKPHYVEYACQWQNETNEGQKIGKFYLPVSMN